MGEFGTVIWVSKQSENMDFRQGTADYPKVWPQLTESLAT